MGFTDFIRSVGNFVSNNVRNIAMFAVAAVTVAVGVAVTIVASPIVAAVAGGALLGAGVSGLMTSLSKNATWKDFFVNMGKGAVIGAVSGLFSYGASAIIARAGLTGFSNFVLSSAVRFSTAIASSIVTNGINNWMNGKKFTEGWLSALKVGAIIGAIGVVAEGFRFYSANAAEQDAKSLLGLVTKKVSDLKHSYERIVDSHCGSLNFVIYGAVEMGKVLAEGAAMQYVTTGEISWKLLIIGAAVYGATRLARAGMEYRENNKLKKENDKLIKDCFDEHEQKHEQNIRDAKALAEHKVNEELQKARENYNDALNDRERTKAQKVVNRLEKELTDIRNSNVGISEKRQGISTCTAKAKDQNDFVSTGRNQGQREHDGKMDVLNGNERGPMNQAGIENPHRDNMQQRYEIDEAQINGETRKRVVKMTQAEAKQMYPDDYNSRDRGCAEKEVVILSDTNNKGPVDLKKMNIVTVGSDIKRDKHGLVVDADHKIKPPCNKGCSEIPFGKNFSRQKDLAEQIQRRSNNGEQSVPILYNILKKDDNDEETTESGRVEGKPVKKEKNYTYLSESEQEIVTTSENDDEEGLGRKIVSKMKKVFSKSDGLIQTLEEELAFETKLRENERKRKEEEERRENEFIRENIIKEKQKNYVTSGGLSIQVNSQPTADIAYPAGKIRSKKRDDDKEEVEPMKTVKTTGKKLNTGKKNIVEVFPIVAWSEKHNKYMMVDHTLWPKPIEGKTKLIAFLGVHKSGRTTLIHSLIYQAGYSMTKEQCLLTKVGLGINMYILRNQGLIFLDICDSMDTIGEIQNLATPMGNLFLEVFGYLNCDHLVYSLPLGQESTMTTEQAISFVKNRVELLFSSSIIMNFAGAYRITIIPRENEELLTKSCKKWVELEEHFNQIHKKIDTLKKKEDIDGRHLTDEEISGYLTEEDNLLGAKHHVKILPVRFFQSARSVMGEKYYKMEMGNLWKSVKELTAVHITTAGIEEFSHMTVYGTMITIWNRLTDKEKCKDLTDCVTEVNNEKIKRQAQGEDGGQHVIEIYSQNLQTYLNQIPADCELAREMEKYFKKRKEWSEKYENTPPEERDSELFLWLLLDSGAILIKECLKMTDIYLQEKGIKLGLSVFSTLLGQGDKTMDIRLLRIGIVDLDLIAILNNPLIYLHYHEAWVIFYFLTTSGFRFHILEIPLWTGLEEILTRPDELIPEKLKIYDWSLHTLIALLDADELPMIPPEKDVGRLNDDNVHLSSNQRMQLDYDYRLFSKDHVNRLFTDTINHPPNASDNYDNFIKLAEEFYNNHEICKETGLKFHDLHFSCREQFAHVTMNHFHRFCAIHFARKVFDNKIMEILKREGEGNDVEAILLQLKLLTMAVGVIVTDSTLFYLLSNSGLHDWLLENFLKKASCNFQVYCHACTVASQIIFVQGSLKIEETIKPMEVKINTLDQVKTREKREEQMKLYGAFRLRLLEEGCHLVAVQRIQQFFENSMSKKDIGAVTRLINFTIKLIIHTRKDDREQFADFFIVEKKKVLVCQMEKLICSCVNRVSFDQPKQMISLLKSIESAMKLITRLMWSYYANGYDNFFGGVNPQSTESWRQVEFILNKVYNKVIRPWTESKNKLPDDSNEQMQSLLQEFVFLALNTSTVSKIAFSDVRKVLGTEKIGDLKILQEDNPRQTGAMPEILVGLDDLLRVELENPRYDTNNVRRAAYITGLKTKSSADEFRDIVLNLVKTSKLQKKLKEESEKRMRLAETRKKRLEALEKRPTTDSGPSYADRMETDNDLTTSSSSSKRPRNLLPACEGVFLKTVLLKDFLLPRRDWEDLLFGKLIEAYDTDVTSALMLILLNNSEDGRRKLKEFIKHLNRLVDNNEAVVSIHCSEPFLSLKWMSNVLSFLDYLHVKGNRTEVWMTGLDKQTKEKYAILNTLEEYLPQHEQIAVKLDTSFTDIGEEVTEDSFMEHTLPEDFFSTKDEIILKSLKKKSIEELRIESKYTCDYVLVRVKTASSVFQAVFNGHMTISSVIENLQSSGIAVNSLKLKPGSEIILNKENSLKSIGRIALFLYSY